MDVNRDGILTYKEVMKAMNQMKDGKAPEDLKQLLAAMDVNSSKCIDYTEFLAAAMDSKFYEEETLCWTAFRYFDLDGDGKITKHEVYTVLQDQELLKQVDAKAIEAVFTACDDNSDGTITFDEFMHMMRNATGTVVETRLGKTSGKLFRTTHRVHGRRRLHGLRPRKKMERTHSNLSALSARVA